MSAFQSNGLLVSRTKTFQEFNVNFLAVENNVYHMDMPEALIKLYGSEPDADYPAIMGQKLATLCITLNEYPCIRYQGSSPFCRAIATEAHQMLTQYKRANNDFIANGDEGVSRERGQLLILDRSFDTVSPLIHEYTYQSMVMDLLDVENGLITYTSTTGKGTVEKQALLGENDELYSEMKYNHIAKVIDTVRGRMNDIIQTSAVAKRGKPENTTITKMAETVRELPEYQQTMAKLGKHVDIAQRCMSSVTKDGLLNISSVEQIISTGMDDDGKEVKGPKLINLLMEGLRSPAIDDALKLRLLAIFIAAHPTASAENKRQLIQAAKLKAHDQQLLTNLERLSSVAGRGGSGSRGGTTAASSSSVFGSLFSKSVVKHAATPEGKPLKYPINTLCTQHTAHSTLSNSHQSHPLMHMLPYSGEYTDTRHVGQLKIYLDQLISGELPGDKFPSLGPTATSSAAESKSNTAKSVRKQHMSRWGKKDEAMSGNSSGSRYLVFVAGGVAYSELRAAHDVSQQNAKEIVIGGSHIITPTDFLIEVQDMS